jgi:hypothetical protein
VALTRPDDRLRPAASAARSRAAEATAASAGRRQPGQDKRIDGASLHSRSSLGQWERDQVHSPWISTGKVGPVEKIALTRRICRAAPGQTCRLLAMLSWCAVCSILTP